MPFQNPYPYGTAGDFDDALTPQIPEVWRIAVQPTVIVYLQVNGVLTEKDRENVEDVIRVLDLTGVALMAIIVRDDGTIIDNAVADVNAGDGLAVTLDAPGVVTIRIPVSGITTAMIADLAITAAKIANDTITAAQLAADSVGNSELAPNAVTNTEVATGAAIAQSKLALAITNTEIAAGAAIAKTKLAALGIVNADVDAAAAIAQSKLALSITNTEVNASAAIARSKLATGTLEGALKLELSEADLVAGNLIIVSLANFGGTWTRWRIVGNRDFSNASVVIDVWKETYANVASGTFTDADRIAGSDRITLSSAHKAESGSLTGWTTAFTARDVLIFEIESVSGLVNADITLEFQRVFQ